MTVRMSLVEPNRKAPPTPIAIPITPPTRLNNSASADVRRHPPRLGEHSVEILQEAGLSQADIDALLASGGTKVA